MTPTINRLTSEQIVERRGRLLSDAHMSLEELKDKSAAYMLDPQEEAILRELEDLEYLESPS